MLTVHIALFALLLILPQSSPSYTICFSPYPTISLPVLTVSARCYLHADNSLSLYLTPSRALRVSTFLSPCRYSAHHVYLSLSLSLPHMSRVYLSRSRTTARIAWLPLSLPLTTVHPENISLPLITVG